MEKKIDVPSWVDHEYWTGIKLSGVPTPCYVVDENRLRMNLEKIKSVADASGCTILMALKGFAMWHFFPLIRKYVSALATSSLHEAQLSYKEFGEDVHFFAPAYKEDDFVDLLKFSSHIVFNSFFQWSRFKKTMQDWHWWKNPNVQKIKYGIRVNPEHLETDNPMYNPCGHSLG